MSLIECKKLGWDALDVILVSGDAYIDSPYIGIAVIGKVLVDAGFRVGVIAQPDIDGEDIKLLGEPRLFWGVSGGSVDSMVANYTALNKRRRSDDYTPGGENSKRPDRAVIAYTNLIRKHFKSTSPIVLGGIEASLRRISHYDFWSNKMRRSILFDAKADYLLYGMAHGSVLELAKTLQEKRGVENVRGLCYIAKERREEYIELPAFEDVVKSKEAYAKSFDLFYRSCDPIIGSGISQKQDSRYLIQNPPPLTPSAEELDRVFDIGYERMPHPSYEHSGAIRAQDTIKFSITTHFGCYGECSFCAIAMHQGRTIQSRSEGSILNEIEQITQMRDFKGIIQDVGGPSANMYGFECEKKLKSGACEEKPCIGVKSCKSLRPNHKRQIELLKKIRSHPKIRKVFVASGIRYDLIEQDKKHGDEYLKEIVEHHISGQLKIAPEHTDDKILSLMNKPNKAALLRFKRAFEELNKKSGKRQFLTYYFIAAHPGCSEKEMHNLKDFARSELKTTPEQVQIFTPSPSTYATLAYYTGKNPYDGSNIFVERDSNKKRKQKEILSKKSRTYGSMDS